MANPLRAALGGIAALRDTLAFLVDAALAGLAAWAALQAWDVVQGHLPLAKALAADPLGVFEAVRSAADPRAQALAWARHMGELAAAALLAPVLAVAALEGAWSAIRRV